MKSDLFGETDLKTLFQPSQRILVTGGAGFIGGCLVRRLLKDSDANVFNLDKCGYASDLVNLKALEKIQRHSLLKIDLFHSEDTNQAVAFADPDFVFHLAAESHVDRSIEGPGNFLNSNVIGTFNLLQAIRSHWEKLPTDRQETFRLLHISTDEVFGSLDDSGFFFEDTPYNPRSPYAATKAASDHLVKAWGHTYGIPVVMTNCSNNFGPWQFPEKLIPVVILKALVGESIPLYGDGKNIRDWLFVEDHVDALLLAASKGSLGKKYCVGGNSERSNEEVVRTICDLLDSRIPDNKPHERLIKYVSDRPGHDYRYAIDSTKIKEELSWYPRNTFQKGLESTVDWYLNNLAWCREVSMSSGYYGERLGII